MRALLIALLLAGAKPALGGGLAVNVDAALSRSPALAEAAALPRVEAFAAATTASDGLGFGAGARLGGVRASLVFGDPAWGARRVRYKEDEAAASAAAEGLSDAVRAEVLSRAAALRGLQDSLPALDEGLAQATAALEQARPLYREGRLSVLEVLRAEEARARMTETRLEAQYALRAQWAGLTAARGGLDARAMAALEQSLKAPR